MQTTPEQNETIRQWIQAGESLSDVQKHIREAFGIAMTYLDVRLLVMELGATVKEKEKPKSEAPTAAAAPLETPAPAGGLSVSVDAVVIPGTLISGAVIFPDGNKARWFFDEYQRFGLEPDLPGYKPSPEDFKAFQQQLSRELQNRGY